MSALLFEHLFLRSSRASSLLPSDLLLLLLLLGENAGSSLFDLFAELASGKEAVQFARALALAFDLDGRGQVFQVDAGGGFVDLLAPFTGAEDEFFDEIFFSDSKGSHPCCELFFFIWMDHLNLKEGGGLSGGVLRFLLLPEPAPWGDLFDLAILLDDHRDACADRGLYGEANPLLMGVENNLMEVKLIGLSHPPPFLYFARSRDREPQGLS